MKVIKSIFIVIGILILVGAGGLVLYNAAYAAGNTDGYADGHAAGLTEGYDEGYSSGEAEGYSSGEAEGYTEGYVSGTTYGYETGYTTGVADGLGHGYTLRDPAYNEVITFLTEDNTDQNEYIEGSYGAYVCSHFARDVCNNAEEQGLRCSFVELRYPDGGHAIIAFDTTDNGLVYFEPQTDERARPVIGERYYQCIESRPGYYREAPSYDDTIMDILVIW